MIILAHKQLREEFVSATAEVTEIALSNADYIKLIFGGDFVGGLAAQIIASLKEFIIYKASERKKASLLALRLAVTFEGFAYGCANQIADYDLFNQCDGYAGRRYGTLPKFPPISLDSNWDVLDSDLLARSLEFPTLLELSDGSISFWSSVVGPDPALTGNACEEEAGIRGLQAWEIAKSFRKKYKLPEAKTHSDKWNFLLTLEKTSEAAIKRRSPK